MKKVLIISFLIFIILIGCFNITHASSITPASVPDLSTINKSDCDYILNLRIGEEYVFNNATYAYFVNSNVSYNSTSDTDSDTFFVTIKGVKEGDTFGSVSIDGETKLVYVTVAKKFVTEVLIVPPTQTRYDVGEKLNLDGLTITVIYDDGNIEQINKGYTVTGYNKNKAGQQTITISYRGFSRSYNVQVGDKVYNLDTEGKLPQTGDFSYLLTGLYVLVSILSISLIYLVYKSFKYNK